LIAEVTGPNGIHAAADGSVWVTAFGGGEVLRVDPDGFVETVVDGAETRNGIIVDEGRGLVFYTNYSAGSILRAGLDGSGPGEIIAIDDASLDGLALDACGHLYTVDNANNRLYRVPLDAHGAATDEPVLLAEFSTSVANAAFGVGEGWSPTSLYVTGASGAVYEVPVGVNAADGPDRS
jgi:sugar lactone lactonase YvrE